MIQELSVLRIGNYLMDKGGIVRVVDIPCEKKEQEEWAKNLRAVPLTVELLEKCGFEKLNAFYYRLKFKDEVKAKAPNGSILFTLRASYIIYIDGDFYIDSPQGATKYFFGFNYEEVKELKYLHQLQNVYYFLTDKELEVKL